MGRQFNSQASPLQELYHGAATDLILRNSQPIAGKVTRVLEMRRADARGNLPMAQTVAPSAKK